MPPRFKAYPNDYYQSQLFPANLFDLLPEDHECFLYRELFAQLDTSEVEAQYSPQGQRVYPPRQVVSILIYAYSHGVFSSREIERRCREDLGFLYIAGRNCPNFRVSSYFRKDHGALLINRPRKRDTFSGVSSRAPRPAGRRAMPTATERARCERRISAPASAPEKQRGTCPSRAPRANGGQAPEGLSQPVGVHLGFALGLSNEVGSHHKT